MAYTAILGASGYSGQETLDRVLAHPELELVALGSDSLAGAARERARPAARTATCPAFVSNEEALAAGAELVFCASTTSGRPRSSRLPARSSSISPARTGSRDAALYAEWYGFEHPRPDELGELELRPPRALPAGRAR